MNPFDQFDDRAATEGNNPFDQFEAPPPGPAPEPPRPSPPKAKRNVYGEIAGFMANVNRGLGVGDELAAAGNTAVNALTGKGPQGWRDNLAAQRQLEDNYTADRPNVAALGRGTGNALTALVPAGKATELAAAAPRGVNALRAGTTAALSGAAYAAADRGSVSERVDAATNPVSMGANALLGGALGGVVSAKPRPGKLRQAAPSLDELRAEKSAAYKAVDESGVSYTPKAFQGLAKDIADQVGAARFNAKLHPKTAAMLDYISELANRKAAPAQTISDLDELRQVVGRDVSSSPDPGERRMGEIIRGKIDDFLGAADPAHLSGGDAQSAVETLRRARDLTGRVKKIEALDGLDLSAEERAATTGTGSNIDNTTRQNVRRFKDNAKNLSPEERQAAERVIRGTPGQNALRAVGRLSPEGGTVAAVGSLVTGPLSGGTIPAVGFVARRVADAITKRNVDELRSIIALGGDAATEVERQLIASPEAANLRRELAARLGVAAGAFGSAAMAPAPTEIEIDRSTDPEHLAWRRAQGLQ